MWYAASLGAHHIWSWSRGMRRLSSLVGVLMGAMCFATWFALHLDCALVQVFARFACAIATLIALT